MIELPMKSSIYKIILIEESIFEIQLDFLTSPEEIFTKQKRYMKAKLKQIWSRCQRNVGRRLVSNRSLKLWKIK